MCFFQLFSDESNKRTSSFQIEALTSVVINSTPAVAASTSSQGGISYTAPLAITGPVYTGGGEIVPSSASDLVPMTRRQQQRQRGQDLGQDDLGIEASTAVPTDQDSEDRAEPKRAVINVNESIVSLMLRLHAKYSGKQDSYMPKSERSGVSTSAEYAESRIGDGCFFIEKVLDHICDLDSESAEHVASSRQLLWPDYHEDEARLDAERERAEADTKKRRAKERQRQMMEQLAQQRQRFIQASRQPDIVGEDSRVSEAGGTDADPSQQPEAQNSDHSGDSSDLIEYTCCHCRLPTPATESRPIGLVTLIQSSSVLAHKHKSVNHLVLPTTEEEENSLPPSWSDSLGLQYEELFAEMNKAFDASSSLLAVHRGWKGGIHIQSCGHHMHYDCRTSYCDTLRGARDLQTLDFDQGEVICPMCRQMANALLPVPPDAKQFPFNLSTQPQNINLVASSIHRALGEKTTIPLMTPGPTQFRTEMAKIMEVFTKTALPSVGLEGSLPQNDAIFVSSIARTNLEADLVQRGGTLVRGRGFADMVSGAAASLASTSSSSASGTTQKSAKITFDSNKNKFCFGELLF